MIQATKIQKCRVFNAVDSAQIVNDWLFFYNRGRIGFLLMRFPIMLVVRTTKRDFSCLLLPSRVDKTNPSYKHLLSLCPKSNAETMAAIRETKDIIAGRIIAKSYKSFSELLQETLAEIAEEDRNETA